VAAVANKKNMQIKNDQVKLVFKRKKTLNTIATLIVFAVAFFAVWYGNNRDLFSDDNTRLAIVVAICAISMGGLLFTIMNWRCPACRKSLGRVSNPSTCKHCGVKLR
jgi:hypothetical protein